jgi:hypothetical protein
MLEKQIFLNFYSQHCHDFTIQCFIFLISAKCAICFQYFGQQKNLLYQLVLLLGIDTDPYRPDPVRHALTADVDPDLAKLSGSDPILILIRINNLLT